jgi:hypothetical protein
MLALLLGRLGGASSFILFDKRLAADTGRVASSLHMIMRIHNVGDSPAVNLHVDDAGIPLEQWHYPQSANDLRWSSLPPRANVTAVFPVRPAVAGNLRQGPARLRYVADGQKKIALSSQVFWFEAGATSSIGANANLTGYAIVIGLAFASVFVPFCFWWTQRPRAKPKAN